MIKLEREDLHMKEFELLKRQEKTSVYSESNEDIEVFLNKIDFCVFTMGNVYMTRKILCYDFENNPYS